MAAGFAKKHHSTSFSILVVLALLTGLLIAAPAAGAPRAVVQAPHGVWSIGDGRDDGIVAVIAIDPGAVGTQHGFFVEWYDADCSVPGRSDSGVLMGPASREGNEVSITGDLRCAYDGRVLIADLTLTLTYDAAADTMTMPPSDPLYPAPFTRKCWPGTATMVGGPGDDILVGTSRNEIIDGRGGNDTIKTSHSYSLNILCGGRGRDRIEGNHSAIDVIVGGGAKDTILSAGGSDGILGWGGNDRIYAMGGHDSVAGGGGQDLVIAGPGDDYLFGGGKKDWLYGNHQNDTLFGNAGLDTVNGGKGTDACEGGDGEPEPLCES